ncbi:uncharacterized protein DNG_02834 [Cephalotrichum gorgonifer]|uniref:Uncharacterized protein n=1 Tax=Cephalotrichum gorgonifer TaxID=2041049 RepID=A0AAE8STF3_9PEZI|nr:uncharacterized protein DNG_02834 [Cephalotrichum gorgonifer]
MASLVSRRFFTTTARRLVAQTDEKVSSEASNVPALALGAGVAVTFAGAAFYFRRSDISSEEVPWDEAVLAKHKWAAKEAPSALNAVVIPNVTLPKEVHDKLNKWGKEGYP